MSAFVTDGTVTVTNGSRTIVGTGTAWNDVVAAGNLFFDQTGSAYGIRTVNSDTELTLNVPYRLGSGSGLTYEIDTTRGAERELAQGVATLLGRYQAYPDIAVRFEGEILPEMRADIATLISDAQASVADALSPASLPPTYNLLPDSGRFADPITSSYQIGAGFVVPPFFAPVNGASAWSSVGKFTHGASSQAEPVASLLSQYSNTRAIGTEFHVAEITAGNGTSSSIVRDGQTYSLLTTNGAIMLPRDTTFGAYLRAVSGGLHVGFSHKQDGIASAAGLLPAGAWRYVEINLSSTLGIFSSFPNLRAVAGSVVQMALPSIVSGTFARADFDKVLPTLAAGAYA